QYDALRWLAQLSANIVDYIDNDDYMTPFNWTATANATFQGSVAGMDPTGQGWVFGTELPRLVINEAYAEVSNDATDPFTDGNATLPYNVNFWAELLNPFNTDPNLVVDTSYPTDTGGGARLQITQNGSPVAAYQVIVATAVASIRTNNNTL